MQNNHDPQCRCLERQGPPPFVTRRVHQLDDGRVAIWSARHHRKGLSLPESLALGEIRLAFGRCWWRLDDLNWWIGFLFLAGSGLFIAGSILTLWPSFDQSIALLPSQVFFIGSLPFTCAAYLQFHQAVNATDFPLSEPPPIQNKLFGCRPTEIGWWSCLLQFLGTLLFNLSTYSAMNESLGWVSQDVWVWTPNMVGSILFLASGYLAFAETCHAYFRWLPGNLSWCVVALNLVGCIGFLTSAFLAVLVSDATPTIRFEVSVWFTLLGAVGFLASSMLLFPEAALKENKQVHSVPEKSESSQ